MLKINKISKNSLRLTNILPYILIMAAVIGMVASFALTYDKFKVIQDPNYIPSCNINPVLSCGSVMKTEQASLLGVPNTLFGLVGFSALLTLGLILVAGTKVNSRVWIGAQVGATAGVIFMHYLFFQGVFRIGAICPWCFVVWMIVIPVFWYITLFNIREGYIKLGLSQKAKSFLLRHHGDILLLWYLLIFTLLITRFWYYFKTLIYN